MTFDKKVLKELLFTLLSFSIAILLLVYTFRGVNVADVFEIIKHINILYLFVFVFIIYTGVYLRALRWKYILETIKPDIRIGNLFNSVIIGYGINVIIPRFGELFRAIVIGKLEGISRGASIGTIFIERMIDVVFMMFAVLLSVMLLPQKLIEVYPWLYSSLYFAIAGIIAMFGGLIVLIKFKRRFSDFIRRIIIRANIGFLKNIPEYIDKIIDGFSTLKTFRSYFFITLYTILMYISYALGAYMALYIFNMQDQPGINVLSGLIIMSITTFGVMIPTPAGTGSYHAFCKSVLTMIYAFEVKLSLAYALLTHFLNTVPFLLITLVMYIIYQKKRIDILKDSQNND